MPNKVEPKTNSMISRRFFLKSSSRLAVVAGGVMAGCGAVAPRVEEPSASLEPKPDTAVSPKGPEIAGPRIRKYRTLGRTGFQVSDISMGCGLISDANVVRYAYDKGINLFDLAEGYGNGDSERKVGQAMPHMQRDKIFLVTKLKVEKESTEQAIIERFGKCMERLGTSYVDALYLHGVTDAELVKHEGFHNAVKKLKADGKVRYTGISSHGPRAEGQDSMEKVLLAAVQDGRFDVMLLVYNFMRSDAGQKILSACKEKNIGTTAMKVYAGKLESVSFDPENPTEQQVKYIEALTARGMDRNKAIAYLTMRYRAVQKEVELHKPVIDAFVAEHGIKTQDELNTASLRWVFANTDMHSVCVSLSDFDSVDKSLPLSGTRLTAANERFLRHYAQVHGNSYCRHGCTDCLSTCPHGVPVSTVMRYSYYFSRGGREKLAMEKYARLRGENGLHCLDCDGTCLGACPYGVSIQASLLEAHGMLTLA